MKLINTDLRIRLAAEYVIGTLRGGARRRFEQFLVSDYALRAEVAKWETHFMPLIERIKPVTPPDRVWANIQARIGGTTSTTARAPTANLAASLAANTGWLGNLKFWRGLGMGASLAASVLLATLIMMRSNLNADSDPMMMAVLEDQGVVRMVVEQPKSGLLMVKMVKPWAAKPNQSMELWVIPKDGAPRTLGVINEQGETRITMPDMDRRLTDGTVFAITNEPVGGSPSGNPTGSVMCKGSIARMPAKTDRKPRAQI